MEITRFMNPNRKNVETKSFLPAGIRIRDIDQRVLNTEEKYIGIVDENGEMLGAIQVERLRFIYQWNQTLDMAQILEHLSIGVIAVDKESRNDVDFILHIGVRNSQIVKDIFIRRRESQCAVVIDDGFAGHPAFEIGVSEVQVKLVAFVTLCANRLVIFYRLLVVFVDVCRVGRLPQLFRRLCRCMQACGE